MASNSFGAKFLLINNNYIASLYRIIPKPLEMVQLTRLALAQWQVWEVQSVSVLPSRFLWKNMIQIGNMPLGCLLAGFLADHIFEPGMRSDAQPANRFGWLVGAGRGAEMALMFALTGQVVCQQSIVSIKLKSSQILDKEESLL